MPSLNPADCVRASFVVVIGLLAMWRPVAAHDVITTEITWNTDLAEIFFAKCVRCHRPDGSSFSLLTYDEARPWAVAIKEEVLTRRMPPWGAASGFGSFRNSMELSLEEIERIADWVDGGAPEEPEPDVDGVVPGPPAMPSAFADVPLKRFAEEIVLAGDHELDESVVLDGIWPSAVPAGASFRMVAQLPNGTIEPLVWIDGYREEFSHPFLLREPIELPKGTVIVGVPEGVRISLLPVSIR